MAIFLDEVEREYKDDEPTIKEVFTTLFCVAQDAGRAIFKFVIDGKEYYIDLIKDFFDIEVKTIQKLEFFSITEKELFVKMSSLGSSLILMTKKLEKISLMLNEGKDLEALRVLQELAMIMHRLFLCHSFFVIFDIPTEYDFGGKSLTKYRKEINNMLRAILDAFNAKDIVEASDIAEYELTPVVENLGQSLSRILEY